MVYHLAAVDNLLAAEYDAVGPGVVMQQFAAGGLGACLVILEVGKKVVVERALAQQMRLVVQGICVKQVGIGFFDGIDLAELLGVGVLVLYHHDGTQAVFPQPGEFVGAHDAVAVDLLDFPFQVPQVLVRGQQVFQVALVVLAQQADGFPAPAGVEPIIGLEMGQQTVLFFFDYFVALVDGKVEGGDELSVFPGFVDVELVIELPVAGQKIYNNRYCADKNEHFVKQVFIETFLFRIEICHIALNFLRKVQKKTIV